MKGYWEQPEAKKDVIISGGENISSLEVEKSILAHPAVLEAAVIAVADARWGEVPKALVVLRPGANATEAEMIQFCRSRLSHFKCPQTVHFVESLPKTATGKVLKKDLRSQYDPAPSATGTPSTLAAKT